MKLVVFFWRSIHFLFMDDDEKMDADMTAESHLGRPSKRAAEQGIADMEFRLSRIEAAIGNIEAFKLAGKIAESVGDEELAALRVELTEAQERLIEYKVQVESLN